MKNKQTNKQTRKLTNKCTKSQNQKQNKTKQPPPKKTKTKTNKQTNKKTQNQNHTTSLVILLPKSNFSLNIVVVDMNSKFALLLTNASECYRPLDATDRPCARCTGKALSSVSIYLIKLHNVREGK